AADFTLSMVRLRSRRDPFFCSMRDAIASFHQALDERRAPELDGDFGAHLVAVCENVARDKFVAQRSPPQVKTDGNYDIAVLGGTGFIGTHLLRRLLAEGKRVGIMARNTRNLPAEFYDDRVVLVPGDVRRPADVER